MAGATCFLCGRPTYDPDKRERPWARAVAGGAVALVCPRCRRDRPEWPALVDHCPACDSTRLSVTLGESVCRECGAVAGLEAPREGL
ncbi:MAG TPA: hypothetical protein VEO00_06175 [Actinomycetota bacterium]|nr:hypothetical protein [Actinomycetota bacterium]